MVLIFHYYNMRYEASNQSGVAADHGSTVVSHHVHECKHVNAPTRRCQHVPVQSVDVVINIFSCAFDVANCTIQGDSVGYHILKTHKTAAGTCGY